jgi:hypothetical protein
VAKDFTSAASALVWWAGWGLKKEKIDFHSQFSSHVSPKIRLAEGKWLTISRLLSHQ